MILNPYKPFRFTHAFSTDDYDNGYVNYTIEFGRHNQFITSINEWVTIYKGKSLVIDGKTTIEVSSVLIDYLKRNTFVYNELQGFEPHNTIKPFDVLTSIEMLGDIANTQIRVSFMDALQIIERDVFDFSIYNDYDTTPYIERGNYVISYNKQNIENHIPLIDTDKYWISLDYAKYTGGSSEATPVLYTDDNTNQLKFNVFGDYGNYSVSLPLVGLYENLSGDDADIIELIGSDVVDMYIGGDASVAGVVLGVPMGAKDNGGGGVLSDGTRVSLGYNIERELNAVCDIAIVDACPSEWYMSWSDLNGWHSVALSSAWEIDDREAFTIKNIYDETRNIKNTIAKTFKIKSKKLNYNELIEYNHIIESTYVVLYNSKTDENYFCHLVDNNVDNTKQRDKKHFECELKEVVSLSI